jgi:hypothetical protein
VQAEQVHQLIQEQMVAIRRLQQLHPLAVVVVENITNKV